MLPHDLNTAYTANDNGSISAVDLNMSNEDVTLSDTTLDVSVLNTLDGNTSGTIDASSVTTLNGAAVDLNTAYDSGGITDLEDEDVTLSDTTLEVSTLNTLDGSTSGTIDASSVTTLTGAAADLNTAYTANDNGSISGLSNEDVTLSDILSTAAVLNTLDGNTSGAIDASSINTLTGAADDLINAYTASNGITGLGDEAVTLSDSGSVLTTLEANTSAPSHAAVVTATLSDGDLGHPTPTSEQTGNAYTITITDTSVRRSRSQHPRWQNLCCHQCQQHHHPHRQLLMTWSLLMPSGGISNLGNEAVSVDSASTDQANTLAAATSGVITATVSDGDLSTLAGLTETGNAYTITITDTSVDAAAPQHP